MPSSEPLPKPTSRPPRVVAVRNHTWAEKTWGSAPSRVPGLVTAPAEPSRVTPTAASRGHGAPATRYVTPAAEYLPVRLLPDTSRALVPNALGPESSTG